MKIYKKITLLLTKFEKTLRGEISSLQVFGFPIVGGDEETDDEGAHNQDLESVLHLLNHRLHFLVLLRLCFLFLVDALVVEASVLVGLEETPEVRDLLVVLQVHLGHGRHQAQLEGVILGGHHEGDGGGDVDGDVAVGWDVSGRGLYGEVLDLLDLEDAGVVVAVGQFDAGVEVVGAGGALAQGGDVCHRDGRHGGGLGLGLRHGDEQI